MAHDGPPEGGPTQWSIQTADDHLVPHAGESRPTTIECAHARGLAVAAPKGQRHCREALRRNRFATLDAVALAALVETTDRGVDPRDGFGLHLDDRPLDIASQSLHVVRKLLLPVLEELSNLSRAL